MGAVLHLTKQDISSLKSCFELKDELLRIHRIPEFERERINALLFMFSRELFQRAESAKFSSFPVYLSEPDFQLMLIVIKKASLHSYREGRTLLSNLEGQSRHRSRQVDRWGPGALPALASCLRSLPDTPVVHSFLTCFRMALLAIARTLKRMSDATGKRSVYLEIWKLRNELDALQTKLPPALSMIKESVYSRFTKYRWKHPLIIGLRNNPLDYAPLGCFVEIVEECADRLASGKFHRYRAVLSADGEQLRDIFIFSVNELERRGFFDQDEAEAKFAEIDEEIRLVG